MDAGVMLWNCEDFNATELYNLDTDATRAVSEAADELNAALAVVIAKTDVDLTINDPTAIKDGGSPVRQRVSLCAGRRRGVRQRRQYVCEETGRQILDALELSVSSMPGKYGGFLQASGLTFEADTSIPSGVKRDEKNMFVDIEGDRRISNVLVGGEPIDLEKTYTVASHNYLLHNGGDGYTIFQNCTFTQESVMLDNQVLLTCITEDMSGVVGAQYANPYGENCITAK